MITTLIYSPSNKRTPHPLIDTVTHELDQDSKSELLNALFCNTGNDLTDNNYQEHINKLDSISIAIQDDRRCFELSKNRQGFISRWNSQPNHAPVIESPPFLCSTIYHNTVRYILLVNMPMYVLSLKKVTCFYQTTTDRCPCSIV